MREIGCCQLGVYIPMWEFAQTNKQKTNKQTNKQTLFKFEYERFVMMKVILEPCTC